MACIPELLAGFILEIYSIFVCWLFVFGFEKIGKKSSRSRASINSRNHIKNPSASCQEPDWDQQCLQVGEHLHKQPRKNHSAQHQNGGNSATKLKSFCLRDSESKHNKGRGKVEDNYRSRRTVRPGLAWRLLYYKFKSNVTYGRSQNSKNQWKSKTNKA